MPLEKTRKQPVAAAVATTGAPDKASSKKTANTDPNKQPGFAAQERALSPAGKNAGGASAKTQDTKPRLGAVVVKSVAIGANGKLKAVVDATIHNANGVPGVSTRSFTLRGGSSLNPFECAECIYDAFQGLDMSSAGLDSSYNIEVTGAGRNAFMEEAIGAVFDKSRFKDERDRSQWPPGYAERFDKRP